jgi:hypothetical protein
MVKVDYEKFVPPPPAFVKPPRPRRINDGKPCTAKRPHMTWADAEDYAILKMDRLRAQKKVHGWGTLFAYSCDFCGAWHTRRQRGGRRKTLVTNLK